MGPSTVVQQYLNQDAAPVGPSASISVEQQRCLYFFDRISFSMYNNPIPHQTINPSKEMHNFVILQMQVVKIKP